jgi:DNA polymerase-3 subunit delta
VTAPPLSSVRGMLPAMGVRNGQEPLSPVTLVTGPETLLAERAIQSVRDAARARDPNSEITETAAAVLAPAELAELTSPSLFATRRVVVVHDVQDVGDVASRALLDVVKVPPEDVHLVLLHPGGPKGKQFLDGVRKLGVREVAADRLTRPDDQVLFVRAEVAAAGARIDQRAAQRLVEAAGPDLRLLAAAAAQLAADSEGEIDEEFVATYFAGRAEVRGWTIADHTVEGRTAAAVQELRWALEAGTAPVLIIGALAGALRTLGRLGSLPRGLRDGDVTRELAVPAWKLRRLRDQLRGWTPGGLEQAIGTVAAADVAVKGGSNDSSLALTRAVVEVASLRAPR